MSYTDPTGELAFLLPAVPWVSGAIADWAVAGVFATAVVATATIPGSTTNTLTPAQAKEKDRDYQSYKDICKQQPPPGLDKCEDAKWRKNRNQQCSNSRDDYTKKWYQGGYDAGHAQQMAELQKAINNADADIKRYCKCP